MKMDTTLLFLYEKKDYKGVSEWLSQKNTVSYHMLTIEGGELKVGPQDFVVMPELIWPCSRTNKRYALY